MSIFDGHTYDKLMEHTKKSKNSFNMKMFFYEQCKNGRFLDKKGALKTSMFAVELP